MALQSTSSRYGSVAVAIHWVSAAAVIALLVSGTIAAGSPAEAKRSVVLVHAMVGTLVLLLTIARIAWWMLWDRHPAPIAGQPQLQVRAAKIVHGLLYVAIVLLGASGITTLVMSGAIPALLGQGAVPDFMAYPPRLAHGLASKLMIALVALHVLAALYHQFIRRDRILARMGIG